MKVIIPLAPVAASRPKVTRWSTYYPPTYQAFRDDFPWLLKKHYKGKPLTGPIVAKFYFYMKIPAKMSKQKALDMVGEYHHIKPDLDNMVKAVMDNSNEILWEDDSQICKIEAKKVYSMEPRIMIEFWPCDIIKEEGGI